jgi:hypothetical protein
MASETTPMWSPDGYALDVSAEPEERLAAEAEAVFDAAWRSDFSAPGFCLLDLGTTPGSHDLRSLMLDLKERLSEVGGRRYGVRFSIRSLGRFDQQETTKFHLDGAPDRSLLVLGYEPSTVRSRLSLADYTRCAHDLRIESRRFLDEFNPMYRKGEDLLARYVTELPEPAEGHSRILLINNSSLPFDEARSNPLGVLHKAEVLDPDDSKRRLVNSMMLAAGEPDEAGEDLLREFVATEEVSKRVYG